MTASRPSPPDPNPGRAPRRRWREYRTASGRSPVERFMDALPEHDAVSVLGAMNEVRARGLPAARHLRGSIWEVRAEGRQSAYRVLFAEEGSKGRVLLALEAFDKKTQKTPHRAIALAESRLSDWRGRGVAQRAGADRTGPDR